MNTEILVIFEQKNGLFTDNCYNFKNKTLDFYKNIACNNIDKILVFAVNLEEDQWPTTLLILCFLIM